MRKIALVNCLALALMFGFASEAMAQNCPNGSFPTVDHDGNRICQGTESNRALPSARNPATGCPNGAYPTIDSRGSKVCSSAERKSDYYDAPRACPSGTYAGNDANGRRVCKSF